MREHIQKLVVPTFVFDTKHSAAFRKMLYNLPLVLAFDVLKQVFIQDREEGLFTGSRQHVADLMDHAKTALPWNDWQCLRQGVNHCHEVVHHGKLSGDIQRLHYIADIEGQLLAWGIITPAQPCLPNYAYSSPNK